ncbi:MAG: hypothetical protein QM820_49895 [Minicystis sp.]
MSFAVSGTSPPPTDKFAAARRTLPRGTRASERVVLFRPCPMAASAPLLQGPLATHPEAANFAAEVHRIHRRYASEVVAANRLCPFLRDVDTGFGAFVAMLDPRPEPDVEATVAAIRAAGNPVIHVVFPLIRPAPSLFERFSGRLSGALKRALPNPPVMATFHPDLVGDTDEPHRLVGLLRRAPDPFVQMIPQGMNEGGTVFAPLPGPGESMPIVPEPVDSAQVNFDKLKDGGVEPLLALIAEIRADRDRSYAPFLKAFGL